MADFTLHNHDSTTSTSMGGMDMSSNSTSSMHSRAFHVSISDPLYATRWTPTTKGQYTGAIIFLIILAFLYRFLTAYRSVLENHWAKTKTSRKVLVASSPDREIEDLKNEAGETTENEAGETTAQASIWVAKPWRWSVDLPRSALAVLASGIGYLLMLAVMTFNVGYFLAVLGGLFAGELAWGRWTKGGEY